MSDALQLLIEERDRLNRAIEIDPRFAAAHANLSFSHFLDSVLAYSDSPHQSMALAETAARLNQWEFLLVAAPIPNPGGTGSPLNPLAIF